MKATETTLLQFLEGRKQFRIPIYQRTYSWTLTQCQQLWKDVANAGARDTIKAHFIGSIVYVERGIYQVTGMPELLIIDGQQRLTTLTLLLDAYGDALRKRGADGQREQRRLYNYYLLNSDEEGDRRYKLLLTQTDSSTLKRLLDDKELPHDASTRLVENHKYFVDQIESTEDLEMVFRGIQKLIVVDIALNREHDNPQLIFESLNSTGLELSQADLIRNYVLMGQELKEQEMLYQDYWHPIETTFRHAAPDQFDRFVRDYLTLRTGTIPTLKEVYQEFKYFAQGRTGGTIVETIRDLHQLSRLYARLALKQEQDAELKEAFESLQQLQVDVAFPFLMGVYLDYEDNTITRADFLSILRTVESYVFRRTVSGLQSSVLGKIFVSIHKEVDRARYVESVNASIVARDNQGRLPGDDEFLQELKVKNIYNFRSRNYLLGKLENHGSKEKVLVETCTVEHVLPQNENLSRQWQEDLGANWKEIQARHLHTLGNLTLTGYNSELSDRSFAEKRTMPGGFLHSPLRLNHDIAQRETWNAEAIQARAERLAQRCLQIWPRPQVAKELVDEYRQRLNQGSRQNRAAGTAQPRGSVVRTLQLEYWTLLATRLRENQGTLSHRPVEAAYTLHFRLGSNVAFAEAFFNVRDGRYGVLVQARPGFYAFLEQHKETVEADLGWSPDWNPKPGQKRATLAYRCENVDLTDKSAWGNLLQWHEEKLERLCAVLIDYLDQYAQTTGGAEEYEEPAELTESQKRYVRYWQGLIERIATHGGPNPTKPLPQQWMNFFLGKSGIKMGASASSWDAEANAYGSHNIRIELIVDPRDSAHEYFDLLMTRRTEIEKALAPEQVMYFKKDDVRHCRVYVRKFADIENEDQWPEQHEWLRLQLIAFDNLFRPMLPTLVLGDATNVTGQPI